MMITINTTTYKFFGFARFDGIFFLSLQLVCLVLSIFCNFENGFCLFIFILSIFCYVLKFLGVRVCKNIKVSYNFSILENIVIKIDEIVLNLKQIIYNMLESVIGFLMGFLMFLVGRICLFVYLSLYIYNLYSFINDILLYLVVFKCFYLVFLLFIGILIFKCIFSFHEFYHEIYKMEVLE